MLPPPQGVEIKAYLAFGPRWVGGAMANCPDNVPWQRVINAKGKVSQRRDAERQKDLLRQEGVVFNEGGRIDLEEYGWIDSAGPRRHELP